ncbi:MAG: c-type cytochrome [Magnetospirillum gryphiswaldense]|nr:c-type cytochrome [Magnetospirillum gryphiswaldense]
MMRLLALLVAVTMAVLLGFDLGPAEALPPSADNGAELAARWCADCHIEQRSDAPTFKTIASRRSVADIRAALSKPHARPMGGISLNRREIDDVTAYIKGLGR